MASVFFKSFRIQAVVDNGSEETGCDQVHKIRKSLKMASASWRHGGTGDGGDDDDRGTVPVFPLMYLFVKRDVLF